MMKNVKMKGKSDACGLGLFYCVHVNCTMTVTTIHLGANYIRILHWHQNVEVRMNCCACIRQVPDHVNQHKAFGFMVDQNMPAVFGGDSQMGCHWQARLRGSGL